MARFRRCDRRVSTQIGPGRICREVLRCQRIWIFWPYEIRVAGPHPNMLTGAPTHPIPALKSAYRTGDRLRSAGHLPVRSSGRWPHRCLARCYRIPRPPTSGSGLRLLLAPAAAISDNEPTLPSSHRAVGKTQQCSVRSFVIGNQLPGFRPTPAPPAPLPLCVLFVHPYSAAPITAHDQMGCSDAYTETGLRVYKELAPMRKDQVDLVNAVAWIPESKTPNGVAEVPLTEIAVEAFRSQIGDLGRRTVAVSMRAQSPWVPAELQEGLERHPSPRWSTVFPALRSSFHLRDPVECWGRVGRMGHAVAAPGSFCGLQEIFADEAADETGGAAEAEPPCQ
jgi:hypothetical protein